MAQVRDGEAGDDLVKGGVAGAGRAGAEQTAHVAVPMATLSYPLNTCCYSRGTVQAICCPLVID